MFTILKTLNILSLYFKIFQQPVNYKKMSFKQYLAFVLIYEMILYMKNQWEIQYLKHFKSILPSMHHC